MLDDVGSVVAEVRGHLGLGDHRHPGLVHVTDLLKVVHSPVPSPSESVVIGRHDATE
ncbi:hypothetical protein [Blastococcus sp. SYSU DS1024]